MTKHDRLRAARKTKGLTRAQVADAIHVSESTYREWERGREPRSLDTAQRLCDVLGITMEYYLTGRDHSASLTPPERAVVDLYRAILEERRACVVTVMEALAGRLK
ncbi:hypothetical protein GCM10011348_46210 [Marinobacterium nitratireducens]|uniref:HTH cro/C1-type domain-containing protein n=1 Tax=Marinobacterium nitratireducens TaxID=518897 RepID=A0A917ZRW1_9GAMM|nr:helix-turn-helix transcriptional regulator [Marinobacterium nitratireducens]GGO89145.1 hypothetical protein GCM10011348_46210 [Marinobacterium nitratireducens]